MKHLRVALFMLVLSLIGFGVVGAPAGAGALAPVQNFAAGDCADPTSGATDCGLKADACGGLNEIDSTQSCGSDGAGLSGIVKTVVTIISYIVGIAGVIMVIVSGLRYITSGGDAGKISSAKNALVYALIGLIIASLAQALVHFALNIASDATTSCSYTVKGHPGITADDPLCKKPSS